MLSESKNAENYIESLPEERKPAMTELRNVILANIPTGFAEEMSYGMIGYIVPHSLYPAGYHCDPKLPLPFLSISSQKNFIAVYHMGLYANEKLYSWFVDEYPKYSKSKPDMGKSCIRFKKPDQIPFKLIGELVRLIKPDEWIALYENTVKRNAK